jgi:hypothetical protein
VIGSRHVGHQRPARAGRRALVAAATALTLLPLGAAPAMAQSFTDPNDPCLGDPPPAAFPDRDDAGVHVLSVDCAAANGITTGREEDGQIVFDPRGVVTRGQMATFIASTLEAGGYVLPAPQDAPFPDVDGDTHEESISQLKQIGVVMGREDGTYGARESIIRGQMTAFLIRAAAFAFGDSVEILKDAVVEPTQFNDVASSVFQEEIAAAVRLFGLSEGETETEFRPNGTVTRAQMATFVVRLLDVTLIPQPQ